jgi:hypothetical protein
VDAENPGLDVYPLSEDTELRIRAIGNDEINHSILQLVTDGETERIDYNVDRVTVAPEGSAAFR